MHHFLPYFSLQDVFVSPGHLPASSLQQQQQQDSRRQLSTTTSDDVFLSPRRPTLESDEPDTGPASSTLSTAASDGTSHSAFTDFDAVKSTGTLQHVSNTDIIDSTTSPPAL